MGEQQSSEKKNLHLPAPINKELAEIVPDPKKQARIISLFSRSRIYSGPLPAPEDLEKYNNIVPGLAERIVKMAENQNAHRIEIESSVLKSQLAESKRGQYIGFIIALMCIGASIVLALNGHDTIAGILGGSTILGLVTVFVTGKKEQRSDLDRKAKD